MLRWGLDWLIKVSVLSTYIKRVLNMLAISIGSSQRKHFVRPSWRWRFGQRLLGRRSWNPHPSNLLSNKPDTVRLGYTLSHPISLYTHPFDSPGTDVAAQASAAFSACSALYAKHPLSSFSDPASLTDVSYATTLLNHAQQLYSFATNSSQQRYQVSVPASADAYSSSGYTDELTLAALFLSLASNSSTLYQQAMTNYKNFNLDQYVRAGSEEPFNWDSKTPGLAVLGAQIANMYPTIANSSDKSVNFTREAEDYLDSILNGHGRTHQTGGMFRLMHLDDFLLLTLLSIRRVTLVSWRLGLSFPQPSTQRSSSSDPIRNFCPPHWLLETYILPHIRTITTQLHARC